MTNSTRDIKVGDMVRCNRYTRDYCIVTRLVGDRGGVWGYWGANKKEAIDAYRAKRNISDNREGELMCELYEIELVDMYERFTYWGKEYA